MFCRPTTIASAFYIIIYLALHGGLFNWQLIGLSCMASCNSRDYLCCSGLVNRERADNWVLIFMGAYYHMGAYIREVLVRTEMGAYIQWVPIMSILWYYSQCNHGTTITYVCMSTIHVTLLHLLELGGC